MPDAMVNGDKPDAHIDRQNARRNDYGTADATNRAAKMATRS
jgi:hypothetical protein